MPTDHRAELAKIKRFDQLIRYLRHPMGWPIDGNDFEELTFEYTPEELGIDTKNAAKIQEIKRLRPLAPNQPWGIFFVKFEPKRLPVVALRRILSQVAIKKRASAIKSERQAWAADDLLFVSNYGECEERRISFAHFSAPSDGHDLPTLKVLGWDNRDTALHLDDVARGLSEHLAWPEDEEDHDGWREQWRAAFTLRHREVITTSRDLSIRLAELARAIRDRINTALAIETERGPLNILMKAFQETLVHDLDDDGFADMYAQTIAYGLLSARIADPHRKTADDFAAHMRTNPFLRELMETFIKVGGRRRKVGGPGIDFDELDVSEVVELLDTANMEAVIRDFGDRNPQEDPVIHFYELFLKEYDAKKRTQRGVFYTPRPVVSFIVRSVDELLRTEFGLEDGLADTSTWRKMSNRHKDLKIPEGISPDQGFVQILDPATGTGTFLVDVIDLIHKTLVTKWKAQGHGEKKIEEHWNEYVPKHLLPRLHGYELLMAPYAIAHLKIGLKLYETGYQFRSEERARVYLTNALEPASGSEKQMGFKEWIPALAHEARAVNEIKRQQRFTVVIGNPPYAKLSANRSANAESLVESYKQLVTGERNVQPLSDDYIKFIAYGTRLMQKVPLGTLSFITNRGWLDGLLHRGMRSGILSTYPHVYILDCHGDSNVGEGVPEGQQNDNVFDIQQGVAIFSFVQAPATEVSVRWGESWGIRSEKYSFLFANSMISSTHTIDTPVLPNFFLRPIPDNLNKEYVTFPSLVDVFGLGNQKANQGRSYGNGIKSNRDALLIDFDSSRLKNRLLRLADPSVNDDAIRAEFGLVDGPYWNTKRERAKVKFDPKTADEMIAPILYRPFDVRWIWYQVNLIQIGRGGASPRLMQNLLKMPENLALLTSRNSQNSEFSSVFCTRYLSEMKTAESTRASYCFPLYIRNEYSGLLSTKSEGLANLSPAFMLSLEKQLGGAKSSPEDLLGYAYAVFYSPVYRTRYAEFLKIDFPRLPLPGSRELFCALAQLGEEIVALHLMESPKLMDFLTTYAGQKNPEVGRVGWSNDTVWLDSGKTNARQGQRATIPGTVGFSGVPEEVWDFHIGGYQVCHKWLKDRKGRTLTDDDITHYQKIIVALNETIRLMKEIDEVIECHGGWPGAFTTKKADG